MSKRKQLGINLMLPGWEKLPAKMARSLLPNLTDILSQDEINRIDGPLRRGDISILQAPFLLDKLEKMRRGEYNNSHHAFSRLYQFCSFLKKLPEQGNDMLCTEAAFHKFEQGEAQCLETNRRIKSEGFPFDSILEDTREIISRILGPLPADFLSTPVKFGPGSTVNRDGRDFSQTSEFYKLSDRLIVPERQKFYLAAHLSSNPFWVDTLGVHYRINDAGKSRFQFEKEVFNKHFDIVPDDFANKISFVPKERDEHRTIGVELNGSVILQMVLGSRIRHCLKNYGLDLNSQGRNKHFARFAKTFKMATIDMKNASNTLSYEVVRALLPFDWFAALNDFRSHNGYCPKLNKSVKYEMFSSMGNGFTFELESLIFYAISLATLRKESSYTMKIGLCKRNVAVFGDDVIIPQEFAHSVIANLNLFGFEVNMSKSFLDGHFFESCGSDYYDGIDVRPFFLRRQIRTLRDAYFVCNSILYKSIKTKLSFLVPAYTVLLKAIARLPIHLGPLHFDVDPNGWEDVTDDLEAVLRVPLQYAQRHGGVRYNYSLCAWAYKKWVRIAVNAPVNESDYFVRNVQYACFLRGHREGRVVLRGRTHDRLVQDTTSQWDGVLTRADVSLLHQFFTDA